MTRSNPGTDFRPDWFETICINTPAAERRAASVIAARSPAAARRPGWLLNALRCIDLTTLAGDDTPHSVARLCARARQPLAPDLMGRLGLDRLATAAVCVYPAMVAPARRALEGSGIPVASVATGFPAGLLPLVLRLAEIRHAVDQGADEVDVVISRGLAIRGEWAALYDEISAMREACGDARMKVILATGELKSLHDVARASHVAMQAGACWIKTSTGKEPVNATLPVSLVMLRAIRDYRMRSGFSVGFKPAGGLRTARDALHWQALIHEELGRDWLRPELFRIGASSLLDDIEGQIRRDCAAHDGAGIGAGAGPRGQVPDMNGIMDEVMETMDCGASGENADAVRDWLAARGTFGHFIGGAFTAPGERLADPDPATAGVLGPVTRGSAQDVARAVAAARRAQPGWAALPGHERARHLRAIAHSLKDREGFLALLEVLDSGRPIRTARDLDLPRATRQFHHHAGRAELCDSEFSGWGPLGVCAVILASDASPAALAERVAPALAAGNTVVVKPAAHAPLAALAFVALCHDAGLPPGVVNVVTGDGHTGAALAMEEIDRIGLVGSRDVARTLAGAVAGRGRRLALEPGGLFPFVVTGQADLDAAVEGVADLIWTGRGDPRITGLALFVAEAESERFELLLQARMGRIRQGDPLDRATDMGAIGHPLQKERILRLCRAAVEGGAELVGGVSEEEGQIAPGYLRAMAPANPAMGVDGLGPIAALTSFRTVDEAVALANGCGPAPVALVWSENGTEALDLATRIRAGTVWINSAEPDDTVSDREGVRDFLAPLPVPASDEMRDMARPCAGGNAATGGHLPPDGRPADIDRAVAAAQGARAAWAGRDVHERAEALHSLAGTLAQQHAEFAAVAGAAEVDCAIRRCFLYAASADTQPGRAVARPGHLIHFMPRPYGVMGITGPESAPFLGMLSLILPAIAMGNTVVALPLAGHPQVATALSRLFAAPGLPSGVVNILRGDAVRLAAHGGVRAIWHAADGRPSRDIERGAAQGLKPVWTPAPRDWMGSAAQGREFLRRAQWVQTVRLPHGALPAGTGGGGY